MEINVQLMIINVEKKREAPEHLRSSRMFKNMREAQINNKVLIL